MCPRIDASERRCMDGMERPMCHIDSDCDGDMKCCFDGCTFACINPTG